MDDLHPRSWKVWDEVRSHVPRKGLNPGSIGPNNCMIPLDFLDHWLFSYRFDQDSDCSSPLERNESILRTRSYDSL